MRNFSVIEWMKLGFESWSLSAEAATVIWLRSLLLAQGGMAAVSESQLMMSEKVAATLELQMAMLLGKLGPTPVGALRKTVAHYGRKVSSNRRRLS